ncbi:MAG: catalase [Lachnospiraceae bacterium]|nr:catalase [Lachnospiraceae bacterium]
MKALSHLLTVNEHRRQVRRLCFKAGLYWQGLTHDLSKYSPAEFFVGAKYYQGNRSPNNAQREQEGVSTAWLHHKGRNKHHLEYWVDYGLGDSVGLQGMRMPVKYVVEMLADRIAACKTYQKEGYTEESPLEYFKKGQKHLLLHKRSGKLLEMLLVMLKERGEEETFSFIRRHILSRDFIRRYESEETKGRTPGGL